MQAVGPRSFDGIDIAIFSAGAARSREWAPQAVAAGAVVVDNSSAFRMDDGVPLVVADVNPHAAHGHAGLIANPNCSTMQLMPVLAALHRRSPLEHVTVATYQSVSGTGQKAIEALREQSAAVLAGEQPPAGVYPIRSPSTSCPSPGAPGRRRLHRRGAQARQRVAQDPRVARVADQRDLRARARPEFALRGRVGAHAQAHRARRARELLAAEDGITVVDDPAADAYPMAIDADGQDGVLVGRIRRDLGDPNALALWVVADNLRKGAATNAVQIAELLVRDSLLRSAA